MRDLLTILAGFLIVVLAAALVLPPFVDWQGQRAAIDGAISRALGAGVTTEGSVRVRLLPSPRVSVDRLRLGGGAPGEPGLDAREVEAEMALTPLLGGEVRFTEVRVGRAEMRMPTSPDGSWALPTVSPEALRRDLAFEDLFIGALTLQGSAIGSSGPFHAETVQIETPSLAGPWRVEGIAGDVPFRLVTGAVTEDAALPVKLTGGGDLFPRFDLDARVALSPTPPGTPPVTGTAKVLFGPPAQASVAGPPIPVVVQAGFKWDGGALALDPVAIEAGEGGGSLRLTGTGRVPLEDTRVALKLEGRRLDGDRLLAAPGAREFWDRAAATPLATPVDLELTLNSVVLAEEELAEFKLRASLERDRVRVQDLRFAAPGESQVVARGEVGLSGDAPFNGRVSVRAAASDRLARTLAKLEGGAPFAAFLDGKPLEASADVAVTKAGATLGDVRVKLGEALVTGSARYVAPDGQGRGRLEAQVGAQGVDLARLPQWQSVFDTTRRLDLSLALDAERLRYGDAPGAGRVTARIASEGPELLVGAFDVVDLAGANARVNGRIAADGSGRIEGRLNARRAAPLIDLLGSVGVGGVAKLVPGFLREGELDVGLTAERAPPDPRSGAPALRTVLRGTAAGGPLQADLRTVAGRTEAFTVRLETASTGLWAGRPGAAGLRRPSTLDLTGARTRSGLLDVSLSGDLGGVRVATTRPFALGAGDDTVESGEATVAAADIGPFLPLLSEGAVVPGPVAAEGRLRLDRQGDTSRFDWSGRVAGSETQAQLSIRPDGAVSGAVSLERLSLPWLTAAFALDMPADSRASGLWPTARFGRAGRAIASGQARFKVGRLDLGRGLLAERAAFALSVNPDGLSLRDLDAALAGGRLSGQITIARHEGLASFVGEGRLDGAALPSLLGPSPFDGRLGVDLKFGASGESLAGVVANLAGSGEIRLVDLRVAQADAGALDRALPRVLNESDPLNSRRLETLIGEELGRGPLLIQAATAPASLVGGSLRFGPLAAATPAGAWQGSVALDLKTLNLDAAGLLTARAGPKGWGGAPPSVVLAFRGPVATPVRSIDVGPLLNGLAAVVLQRELEKIEAFEIEANERARLKGRLDYERDLEERERRAAEEARRSAEDAARQARLAAEDEARRGRLAAEDAARRQVEEARQARLREQQAIEEARLARIREQRANEEAARQARLREQQEAAEAARQARLRDQQAAEEARQARAREQQAETERLRANSLPPPPVERSSPTIQIPPGG